MPVAACEPFAVFVPLTCCEDGSGEGGAIDIMADCQGSLSHIDCNQLHVKDCH